MGALWIWLVVALATMAHGNPISTDNVTTLASDPDDPSKSTPLIDVTITSANSSKCGESNAQGNETNTATFNCTNVDRENNRLFSMPTFVCPEGFAFDHAGVCREVWNNKPSAGHKPLSLVFELYLVPALTLLYCCGPAT